MARGANHHSLLFPYHSVCNFVGWGADDSPPLLLCRVKPPASKHHNWCTEFLYHYLTAMLADNLWSVIHWVIYLGAGFALANVGVVGHQNLKMAP